MELYELLGVEPHATLAEIKTAYRKKSLTCHPDKNPNKEAVAEFYKLQEAIKLLSDNKARAAYDESIAAKKRAKERSREFDAKRKKFKDDLEAREEAFKRAKSDEERKKAEIEKLRKEGDKLLAEEALMEKQRIQKLCKQFGKKESSTKNRFIIKIRWHTQEDDPSNGGYDYNLLYKMFSKYGDIVALVMSSVKKGTAMVEFGNKNAAETALLTQIGLIKNPLKLRGLWEGSQKHSSANSEILNSPNFASTSDIFAQVRYKMSNAECEVLSNLRRAEERKRLIEELKAEDET